MLKANTQYLVFSNGEKKIFQKYFPGYQVHIWQDSKDYQGKVAIIRDVRSVISSYVNMNQVSIADSFGIASRWNEYIDSINHSNIIRFEDLILDKNHSSYHVDNWFDNLNFNQNKQIWNISGVTLSKNNYLRYCSYPLDASLKFNSKDILNKYHIDGLKFKVPSSLRKGSLQRVEADSVKSGKVILEHIKARMGNINYEDIDILDYGCGVKFTQSIIQFGIKVKSYTGIDLDNDMIDYLSREVEAPNMSYYEVNFQNDMYNPGEDVKMNSETSLPTNKKFDLMICQSVFTHLDKDDFENLLVILRKNTKVDTNLFFTCFIDNIMKDNWKDANPKNPLVRIFYKEEYVRSILDKTGWDIVSYNRRSRQFLVGDNFLCKPK